MFSLESPHLGDSNENTKIYHFRYKKENLPKLSQICSHGIFSQGNQEQVRNSRGKRAISVRAIEVLLYLFSGMNKHVSKGSRSLIVVVTVLLLSLVLLGEWTEQDFI